MTTTARPTTTQPAVITATARTSMDALYAIHHDLHVQMMALPDVVDGIAVHDSPVYLSMSAASGAVNSALDALRLALKAGAALSDG